MKNNFLVLYGILPTAVAIIIYLTILGTPSVELSNAHVDVIEDAQTLPQVPQNWHEQIRNEHDNSGV